MYPLREFRSVLGSVASTARVRFSHVCPAVAKTVAYQLTRDPGSLLFQGGVGFVFPLMVLAVPSTSVAAPLEYDCREALLDLASGDLLLERLVEEQSLGTVFTLRNLNCFVDDSKCSCLQEMSDSETARHELARNAVVGVLNGCFDSAPDRSLSGVVQEAIVNVCELPSECFDAERFDPDADCPSAADPVCGCDGQTHRNSCAATATGILRWEPGECRSECFIPWSRDPDAICPAVFDPVCGCDGTSYSNSCEARADGIGQWEDGECPGDSLACTDPSIANPDLICAGVYEPVCGCDGKTYSNSCEAGAAGVVRWEPGACAGDETACLDESLIDPNRICSSVFEPVCGCDGKAYSNSCQAEARGVARWTQGSCPPL